METTIVTNEAISETNLLNLIVDGNVEGIKALIKDINTAINANWEISTKNSRILGVLKAAGFEETNQYKQISSVNKDIAGTNANYDTIRLRAYNALDEF